MSRTARPSRLVLDTSIERWLCAVLHVLVLYPKAVG